jgi:hypothetical protein
VQILATCLFRTVSGCGAVEGVASVCVLTESVFVVEFVREKRAGQAVSYRSASGQVHESWERDRNSETNMWRCTLKRIFSNKAPREQCDGYSLGFLYSPQIFAHLSTVPAVETRL